MARLNDAGLAARTDSSVTSVEARMQSLRQRFKQQNMQLVASNSEQAVRIQTLTRESSQLLAENVSLRQEIVHLQAELERRDKQLEIHENNKGTIQLLEEKLADFNQLFKTLNQPVETESPYLPPRSMRSSHTPDKVLQPLMTPIEEEAQSSRRTSFVSSRRRSSMSSINFDLELPPQTTDTRMFNVGSRRRRDSVLIRPFQVDMVTEPDPSPVKAVMPEPELSPVKAIVPEPSPAKAIVSDPSSAKAIVPEPSPAKAIVSDPSSAKAIVPDPSPVKAIVPEPESSPIKPASTPIPAVKHTPSLPARKALEPKSTNSEVTGATGRAARRTRPAISYAEPSLRQKMRREDKGFVDAVSGEGKAVRRSSSVKRKTSKEAMKLEATAEEPENATRWKEFETETKPRVVHFEDLPPAPPLPEEPPVIEQRTKKTRSAPREDHGDESDRARIKKSRLSSSTDDEEDRKAARARRRSALV